MTRAPRIAALVVLFATAFVGAGARSASAATACTTTISNATVPSHVEVPAGATCTLSNVTVRGDVLADPGSTLVFRGVDTVNGSILSNPTMQTFSSLGSGGVTVRGRVTLNGLSAGPNFVCEMNIGGNLDITNSQPGAGYVTVGYLCDAGWLSVGGPMNLTGNATPVYVGGSANPPSSPSATSLSVSNNSGGGHIENTTVRGSLACLADDPTFTTNNNHVGGLNGGASGFCPGGSATATHWIGNDFTTHTQNSWTTMPASSTLEAYFSGVYTTGSVAVGNNFTVRFTTATAVLAYIPATGTPSKLTGNLVDPASSPAGSFGGDVLALRLNADYSDGGHLVALSGLHFGDLITCGLTDSPDLNGKAVRDALGIANTALGGGTTTDTIDVLDTLARNLNASFDAGTPTTWAQQHLANGHCA